MTVTLITADIITNAGTPVQPASNTLTVIMEGVNIVTTGNNHNAISNTAATAAQVQVDGTVIGDQNGIRIGQSGTPTSNSSVYIGQTGFVAGVGGVGVTIRGSNSSIINWGDVVSYGSTGLFMASGTDNLIVNNGTVSALDSLSVVANAVSVDGNYTKVINNGLMTSTNIGAGTVQASGNSAGAITIENHGQILSAGWAFDGSTFSDIFHNSGLIYGVLLFDSGFDQLFNTGRIDGVVDMGSSDNSGSKVINSGSISGTTTTTTGADTVVNRGTFENTLSLGTGNDVYSGRANSFVDQVFGEGGNDTLIGGHNADDLRGGGGRDTIRGRGGDDTIRGETGNDTLFGGSGNDDLKGSAGNDIVNGGSGDDILAGDAGIDILNGGTGDDELTGGAGADKFVFSRNSGDDTILDFEDGTDKLNVSSFGLQNFASVSGAINYYGADAFIDLSLIGGNGSVLILNVANDALSGADFIF